MDTRRSASQEDRQSVLADTDTVGDIRNLSRIVRKLGLPYPRLKFRTRIDATYIQTIERTKRIVPCACITMVRPAVDRGCQRT